VPSGKQRSAKRETIANAGFFAFFPGLLYQSRIFFGDVIGSHHQETEGVPVTFWVVRV